MSQPRSRSQAFAEGQPAFSWRVEKIEEGPSLSEGRYKVTCKNYPHVFAFGNSEQEAMRAATRAIEAAAEKAEL